MKTMAMTGAAAALATTAAAPKQALAADENASTGEVKRVRSCCRACGKVECGVWVTVQDNKVLKVEGDESAPQSRGHCCAKSQSSMQALYHPDRVRYPVKRTNPKGSDDPGWVRISMDEAFEITGQKLGEIKDKFGGQAIFVMCGTSRVWSLGPYQGMKQLFGTPQCPSGLSGVQGSASLRWHHDRRDGFALDGSGSRAEGVRAVGHRC